MSMTTANTVIIATAVMGLFLFLAVYIGLHFSKKSAEKLRKSREKELENSKK